MEGVALVIRFAMFSLMAVLMSACSDQNADEALGTLERDRIILKATANEIII